MVKRCAGIGNHMRTTRTASRLDLILEDQDERKILEMACLNEANKIENRAEKIQKYQQLSYKLPGSVIKQLEENIRDLLNEKKRAKIVSKMQKTFLWECFEYGYQNVLAITFHQNAIL